MSKHKQAMYSSERVQALFKKFDVATWQLAETPEQIEVTRYAYLHAGEFFRHANITRAGAISTLPENLSESLGATRAETHAGEMSLDEWTAGHLDGVIVVHKGEIIYERYPRMRPSDKHVWWSITKSVAGTLVGILEQQGRVDVSQPIEIYIPELAGSGWQGIAVRDILDMCSGMNGLEADDPDCYTNPESPYGLYESSLGIMAPTPKTMASTYDYVASLTPQKAPGEKHEYTSVNTFVLSWLVEKACGKAYAEIVSEVFWQPMGAEADAMLQVSAAGAPSSHGMMSSTLRDLARYGLLFTPSWSKLSDKAVIPQAFINKLQSEGRPAVFKAGLVHDYFNGYALGDARFSAYQFDFTTDDGDFAKAGYHGQTLYISPSKDLVVASFATAEQYDTFKFARTIAKAL